MKRAYLALSCAILFLAWGVSARAQGTSTLRGRVVDAEQTPVAGAAVTVIGTRLQAVTDTAGRFQVEALSPGRYHLRVEHMGYESVTAMADAGGAEVDGVAVTIALKPRPLELSAVTVIGSSREVAEVREQVRRSPGSVALLERQELRSTRQANLADVLRFTPGVLAQPRFGAADETQLSIRGSGLRNNFHLRGVSMLVNGMPYRNADGFTDFESLELLTVDAMEVYKAANAFRWGGATLGGAINLETKTGYTGERMNAYGETGGFGFYKGQLSAGSVAGPFDYYASYARTGLDGFRRWSGQSRDRLNLHAGYVLSPRLDARTFYLYARVHEQLPGSLTRQELDADPTAAVPINVSNRWGRDYTLHHLGAQLRAELGEGQRLEVAPYFQYRDIVHPIFQVIDQVSRDFGAEARYQRTLPLAGHANDFSAGVQWATGNVDDRNYENLAGREGELRKSQLDRAGSLAVYAENSLELLPRLRAVTGLRWSRSTRGADDRFLSNGDQSDRRVYTAVLPRLGLLWSVPGIDGQLFANLSGSYEPPLLLELNSLAVPGFVNVLPQRALQAELGSRGSAGGWRWDAAVYQIRVRDEILNLNVKPFPGASFTVPTYRNAALTRHVGAELGLQRELAAGLFSRANGGDQLTARLAYTYGRFRYVRDSVYAGHLLPGAPAHVLDAEVTYRHPRGVTLRPSLEWVPGDYYVDSGNTTTNRGWLTVGGRAELLLPHWGARVFLEGRNLTDRVYSGAVTVDDAAGRFYLPADRRSVYAGIQWQP